MKSSTKRNIGLDLVIIGVILPFFRSSGKESTALQIALLVIPAILFIVGVYLMHSAQQQDEDA